MSGFSRTDASFAWRPSPAYDTQRHRGTEVKPVVPTSARRSSSDHETAEARRRGDAYYVSHMDRRENPQAALELLILKTLAAGPNHGFGIALHIEESSSALLRVRGRIPLPRAPSSGQGGVHRCGVDRDAERPARARVSAHQIRPQASEGDRRELGHADRRRAEGAAMGLKGSWFRRRPSDDEMREELEAHVAMRAEHDRVDEAAARRRLGNLLHTRESMRRVWIAEWWDALRQDARFTWRSWRRQPGVRAGADPRAGARPRRLHGALRGARPRALQAAAVRGSRSSRLRRPGHRPGPGRLDRERCRDAGYVQVWDTTPAPFESVTAMDTCDVRHRRRTAGGREVRLRRAQLSSRAGRARRRWAVTSRRRTTCAERRASRSSAMGCGSGAIGADPAVVGRTLSLETPLAPAQQSRSSASCRRTSRCRLKPPTSCSRLSCVRSTRDARSDAC